MSIANELITRGWAQGGNILTDGSVCLVGAVHLSIGNNPLNAGWDHTLPCDVREALYHAIESVDPQPWELSSVDGKVLRAAWAWNDEIGRTYDDVLRVAKEADELLGAL